MAVLAAESLLRHIAFIYTYMGDYGICLQSQVIYNFSTVIKRQQLFFKNMQRWAER